MQIVKKQEAVCHSEAGAEGADSRNLEDSGDTLVAATADVDGEGRLLETTSMEKRDAEWNDTGLCDRADAVDVVSSDAGEDVRIDASSDVIVHETSDADLVRTDAKTIILDAAYGNLPADVVVSADKAGSSVVTTVAESVGTDEDDAASGAGDSSSVAAVDLVVPDRAEAAVDAASCGPGPVCRKFPVPR